MAPRPRRSTTATTSYAHLLTPLSPSPGASSASGSGSSASEDEGGPQSSASTSRAQRRGNAATAKGKGKTKAAAQDSDDESDGSVFDPDEDKPKKSSKGGDDGDGDHGGSSESGSEALPSSDDDDSIDPDDELDSDDILGSDEGSESDTNLRRKGKGKAKLKRPPAAKLAGASTRPSLRGLTQPIDTTERNRTTAGGMAQIKRTRIPAIAAFRPDIVASTKPVPELVADPMVGEYNRVMGPAWEPPVRVLGKEGNVEARKSGVSGQGKAGPGVTEWREAMSFKWGHCPWGIGSEVVQDVGWWKGKWDLKGGKVKERWGGSYEEVWEREREVQRSSTSDIAAALPRLLYPPNEPSKLWTYDAVSAREADADAEGDDDELPDQLLLQPETDVGRDADGDVAMDDDNDSHYPTKPGFHANVGGPVSGIAWCPRVDTVPLPETEYLAVTTQSHPQYLAHDPSTLSSPLSSLIQIWSLDSSVPSDFSPSTSEIKKGEGMVFEYGIVVNVVNQSPIFRLALNHTTAFSFDWGSHERIVGGFSNGAIAVWDIGVALKEGLSTVRPTLYLAIHTAVVRSVAFVRTPPPSTAHDGKRDLEAEPQIVAATGYDGSVTLVDLRDPGMVLAPSFDRDAGMVVRYDPSSGKVIGSVNESHVFALSIDPGDFGQKRNLVDCGGKIWHLATSDHHPFTAVVSSDGTCVIVNSGRTLHRRRGVIFFARKLFQIDHNRKTGECRIYDNILPEARNEGNSDKPKSAKSKAKTPTAVSWNPAWDPAVGVLKTDWHPSLTRGCLLATGTAMGLLRVDWVEMESGK
ncbi:transcription factor TFIIIC complex subunit Tfc6 [Pseudohyphozyma bogoriensis]|nr:transcription factor TFIIIC complex subunit Tfc6 [Pseudohyphozyma bogoriensis]